LPSEPIASAQSSPSDTAVAVTEFGSVISIGASI
jgi:hypothetical protein